MTKESSAEATDWTLSTRCKTSLGKGAGGAPPFRLLKRGISIQRSGHASGVLAVSRVKRRKLPALDESSLSVPSLMDSRDLRFDIDELGFAGRRSRRPFAAGIRTRKKRGRGRKEEILLATCGTVQALTGSLARRTLRIKGPICHPMPLAG